MLNKFCGFVVDKRKIILPIFLVFIIASAVLMHFVKINYDMSDYIPKESESYKSMLVMREEFGSGGTLTVMLSKAGLTESYKIKKQIAAIDNVTSVMWLDSAILPMKADFAPGLTDEAFLDLVLAALDKNPNIIPPEYSSIFAQFYKEEKSLFQVAFKESAFAESTVTAINKIDALGKEINLAGEAASSYQMKKVISHELIVAIIAIAPLLLLLLFTATSSFFDPIIYITIIGISVLLNMGSNIMMESISYLTNSIAALIQVAVSMDYSIFLMHSYKKYRKQGLSSVDSAKASLKKSLSPVSASAMTTIAGFVALMFMSYTIGFDIGAVLAKGIVFGLITTFLFMPGFLVLSDKLIQRGEHRNIFTFIKSLLKKRKKVAAVLPKLETQSVSNIETLDATDICQDTILSKSNGDICEDNIETDELCAPPKKDLRKNRIANGVIKTRFIFPIILLLLIIPAYLAQSNNVFMYGELASSGGPGSILANDRATIEAAFGSQNNVVVLLNKKHATRELDLTQKLSKLEKVSSAQSYSFIANMSGGVVPDYLKSQFISENYSRIVLVIDTDEESKEAFAVVDEIRALVDTELDDGYYLLGSTVSTQELKVINNKDYTLATTLALIFIIVILFVNTRNLIIPIILGVVIQSSIWINLAIPFIISQPLVFLGYLIVSCFQMGCTIDYGILLTSHYTDCRKTMNKFDAGKQAFLSSFGSIALSASILMLVGFTMGIVGSIPSTAMIGLFLGTGTLVSFILMMFILPQLLVIFDKPILKTTLKLKIRKKVKSNTK